MLKIGKLEIANRKSQKLISTPTYYYQLEIILSHFMSIYVNSC
jgi:hypothetical protein